MALRQPLSEDYVKDLVLKLLEKETPHVCWTCEWCQFRRDEKPCNRICRYPGSLKVEHNICMMWKFEPRAERRRPVFGFY